MKSKKQSAPIVQSAVAFVVAALTLVACSDYDNGYTEQSIAYDKQFTDIFGKIDPNQDWSMAAYVTAKVTATNAGKGSTVKVYTDAPTYGNAKILASTTLDGSDIKFNIVKGTEQVYAIVRNNDNLLVQGYYDVQDGMINISDSPVERRVNGTRASNGVTKGEDYTFTFSGVKKFSFTQGQGKSFVEYMKAWEDNPNNWVPFRPLDPSKEIESQTHNIFIDENINIDVYETIYKGDSYNHYWIVNWKGVDYEFDGYCFQYTDVDPVNIIVTCLDGVTTTPAEPWTYSLGHEMFGPDSFFEETINYRDPAKQALYTDKMLESIESGFVIHTTGGEIEIPFIYGGTAYFNQFGYVYYKDGQDPLECPHYILMRDASPQNNISFNGTTPVQGMELPGWVAGEENGATVVGTTYKLSFFGDNYENEQGDDYFPEGYNIVFFICRKETEGLNPNTQEPGAFNYSSPSLNMSIGHYYELFDDDNWGTDYSRGIVRAAAWRSRWKGETYTFLGFEDGSDVDLNDIVFWVEGSFETTTEIPDVPTDDDDDPDEPEPDPEDPEEPTTPQSWILACEDLGGSFDYDFNDVVWELVPTFNNDEQSGWQVKLLAAGGTLPVELLYNGETICEDVHIAFNQSLSDNGLYAPINVGQKATVAPVTLSEPIPNGDVDAIFRNFAVKVKPDGENSFYVTAPQKDGTTAPQIILLPGEWRWPRESVLILKAYNNFDNWVENATWTQWTQGAPGYENYTTKRYGE